MNYSSDEASIGFIIFTVVVFVLCIFGVALLGSSIGAYVATDDETAMHECGNSGISTNECYALIELSEDYADRKENCEYLKTFLSEKNYRIILESNNTCKYEK